MNEALKYNLVGLLTIGSIIALFVVDNNYVKMTIGILLIIVLIISFVLMQKSVELTVRQKRGLWVILLPIGSMIFYIISLFN